MKIFLIILAIAAALALIIFLLVKFVFKKKAAAPGSDPGSVSANDLANQISGSVPPIPIQPVPNCPDPNIKIGDAGDNIFAFNSYLANKMLAKYPQYAATFNSKKLYGGSDSMQNLMSQLGAQMRDGTNKYKFMATGMAALTNLTGKTSINPCEAAALK